MEQLIWFLFDLTRGFYMAPKYESKTIKNPN